MQDTKTFEVNPDEKVLIIFEESLPVCRMTVIKRECYGTDCVTVTLGGPVLVDAAQDGNTIWIMSNPDKVLTPKLTSPLGGDLAPTGLEEIIVLTPSNSEVTQNNNVVTITEN